jgi:hypothetical protein
LDAATIVIVGDVQALVHGFNPNSEVER